MLNSPIRRITQRALAAALLGAPFILLSAVVPLANRINGISTFFSGERYGLEGKPFKALKFKSMRDGNQPDEQRVTKIGRLIRKGSADEFAQMLNVMKGDMDLVGPRPLDHRLDDILDRHFQTCLNLQMTGNIDTYKITAQMARFENLRAMIEDIKSVKPGITGAVQISPLRGHYEDNSIETFEACVRRDYDYVQTRKKGVLPSIWQDAVIIVKTPLSLVFHPGQTARKDQITAPEPAEPS